MLGRHSLYQSPTMEALKWAAIFALACGLVLQLAKRLGGTEPPRLSSGIISRAVPVEHWTEDPHSQQFMIERFWSALDVQASKQPSEAIASNDRKIKQLQADLETAFARWEELEAISA